jgi:hypothetical protein
MEVGSRFILNFVQFLQDQLPSLPPLNFYLVFNAFIAQMKQKRRVFRAIRGIFVISLQRKD